MHLVFVGVYGRTQVKRPTCSLVLCICVMRKVRLCFRHVCVTVQSVSRYQRFVAICCFLPQGLSILPLKHCIRLHCFMSHKIVRSVFPVFWALNVTSYSQVSFSTDLVTFEAYEEVFFKELCMNITLLDPNQRHLSLWLPIVNMAVVRSMSRGRHYSPRNEESWNFVW